MALLSLPLTVARLTYRVAIFPARTTLHLTVQLAEDVLESLRGGAGSLDVADYTTPTSRPAPNGGGGAVQPVRPAAARRSGGRRGASTPGISASRERANGEQAWAGDAPDGERRPSPAAGALAEPDLAEGAPAEPDLAPDVLAEPPDPAPGALAEPDLAPGAPAEPGVASGNGAAPAAPGARPAADRGPASAARELDDLVPGGSGHVEVETELVAESAEPGAENGAGAHIRVDQPWPGYRKLKAREVLDRLPATDAAALTVLLLYERTHRARRSVLEAAERELERRRPSSA